jgi:hypothetical protein
MSNINFSNPAAQPGDSIPVLYAKLLQSLGGQPALGDTQYDSIRKIAELQGADPRPGDTTVRLLSEWLAAESGSANGAQSAQNAILAELLRERGGTPQPGDYEWLLVAKLIGTAGTPPPDEEYLPDDPGITPGQLSYHRQGLGWLVLTDPVGDLNLNFGVNPVTQIQGADVNSLTSISCNSTALVRAYIEGAIALTTVSYNGAPLTEDFAVASAPLLNNISLNGTNMISFLWDGFLTGLVGGSVNEGTLSMTALAGGGPSAPGDAAIATLVAEPRNWTVIQ